MPDSGRSGAIQRGRWLVPVVVVCLVPTVARAAPALMRGGQPRQGGIHGRRQRVVHPQPHHHAQGDDPVDLEPDGQHHPSRLTRGHPGVGISDGTNAYSVGYGVLHNPGTPSSRRRINSSAIHIIYGSGTLSLEGTVAFTSTQVTFTWTTRTSAAQTVINYILFGGSVLEAMVRQWSVGTTNGTD